MLIVCLFVLDNLASNIKQFLYNGVLLRDISLVNNLNKRLASPVRITLEDNYMAVLDNWQHIHLYDIDGN